MTHTELAADVMQRDLGMVNATLGDFSDADMLVRPAPKANHPAWQLGHLIGAETMMVNAIAPGAMPELPAGFDKKFDKANAGVDDPSFFPKKADLLAQLAKTRAGSIAWVRSLKPADMDKPGPDFMKDFCPTVGHIVHLLPQHTCMHMGQFQVARRKLGKPVLF